MRRRNKNLSLAAILIAVVLMVFGVELPPRLLSLLPPEIAEILRPAPPASGPVDLANLPETTKTFAAARDRLYERVYADRRESFYCGCRYSEKLRVSAGSCGYRPYGNAKRAERVEAEHIVPASWIGRGRACWSAENCRNEKGDELRGRSCCLETDPVFITAHNDLMNLVPAVGDVNGTRSNLAYAEIPGEAREFGQCDFEVSLETQVVEPTEATRGFIARVALYMAQTYGVGFTPQQKQLFETWNREYPPDDWERERNARIREIQGLGNPFVERYSPTVADAGS